MEYQVITHDHSLGEYYKRFSGDIKTSAGHEFSYEYGEYPYPETDENGGQIEVRKFRVILNLWLDRNHGDLLKIANSYAPLLLRNAGVWNAEHLEYLRSLFAEYEGSEVLRV